MRSSAPRPRRYAGAIVLVMIAFLIGGAAGLVAAWSASTSNPGTGAQALVLAPSANVTASTPGGPCVNVAVSWTAVPGATSFRLESRSNGGPWIIRSASTGNVTSFTDTGPYAIGQLDYRLTSLITGTSWTSASSATSNQLICSLIGPVTNLSATNPCSISSIGWTAAPGANNYDVERRVNGGAWTTLATNQAAATYTDSTMHANGASVEYRIRPGVGATNGSYSSPAAITDWQSFRVLSIALSNGGVAGTVGPGDQATITFSKPVAPASLPAATSIFLQRNGGQRGIYFASTNTTITNAIGRVQTPNNTFGANTTLTGAVNWLSGDTVYQWTRSAGATTQSGTIAGLPFTAGGGARCAADNSLQQTSTPTLSGSW